MEERLQPDIFILGLRIQEPVTAATDILIALTSFYAYWRLNKVKSSENAFLFLKFYFISTGIAMMSSAIIGHGLFYMFSLKWKVPGWFLNMFAITLIGRSAIEHARHYISKKWTTFFLTINVIELITLMGISVYTLKFLVVQIHLFYGMLMVTLPFHLYVYYKKRDIGSRFMLYGVGVLLVVGFIFNYPIVISKWFVQDDFAHVLIAFTTILFMHGGLNFGRTVKDEY